LGAWGERSQWCNRLLEIVAGILFAYRRVGGDHPRQSNRVMLPLLSLAADGEEHRLREAIEELADHFNLTEDLKERIAK
jgi:hypothetical protein